MKRIAFLLAFFCTLAAHAQTWQKVNGRWQYQFLKSDSTFTPPQDTLLIAPIGSIAVKNDVVYFKNSSGVWVSLVGLSVNIATSSLTATGNYTQHWNNKNLNFDSVGFLGLTGYGSYFGGPQRVQFNFVPNSFTQALTIAHTIRNAANTSDSATRSIVYSAGGIAESVTASGKTSTITLGDNAAGQTVTINAADSIYIGKAVAKSAADSVFAVGPLQNSGKTNVLYKVPVAGLTGKNLATAALTATGDYTHNWANHNLFIDTLKGWQFKYYTDGTGGYAGMKRLGYYQFSTNTGHLWYDDLRNVANTSDSLSMVVQARPEYFTVQPASGFLNTAAFFVQNGLIQQQAIRVSKQNTFDIYTDSLVARLDSNGVSLPLKFKLVNVPTAPDTTYKLLALGPDKMVYKFASNSAFTADSTIFSTNYRRDTAISDLRNVCQWPTERTLGVLYNKSSWVNTNDFVPTGSAVMNMNGQYIDISGGSGTFGADYFTILGPTALSKWKMTVGVKLTGALTASSGMAFGLKYYSSTVPYDLVGSFGFNNSLSTPIYIAQSTGSVLQTSGSNIAFNTNHLINIVVEFKDSAFIVTANNVTTGGSPVTVTYTIPNPAGGAGKAPARCYFAIYATSGTQQLQYLKIESAETQFPSILIEGDSKTQLGFANYFTTRLGSELNATYPSVVTHAGEGDEVAYSLAGIDEIRKIGARVIVNNTCSNSFRHGKTFAQVVSAYDSLTALEQATGALVYHIVMPEDTVTNTSTSVGMTALKNYIAAKYGSYYISGVWDTLQSGNNVLKSSFSVGDGIHLNQAGVDATVEKIVQFGIPYCSSGRVIDGNFLATHISNTASAAAAFTGISGTTNRISKFTGPNTVGNSSLYDNGSIGFNTTSPVNQFEIAGNTSNNSTLKAGTFEVQSSADGNGFLSNNGYFNSSGSSWVRRVASDLSILQFNGSTIYAYTAPTGAAGSSATLTQRLSIDPTAVKVLNGNIFRSDGGVGVGTDPAGQIDLLENINALARYIITNNNSGNGASAEYKAVNNSGYISGFGIKSSGYTPYGIFGNNSAIGAYSNSPANLGFMADNATGFINFSTGGNSERMRITPDGNFLLKTTTNNGHVLQVNGAVTINKDSAQIISTPTTQYQALIDTATGLIQRQPLKQKFTQTADAVVNGTNTETTLVGSGVGTLTIPANYLTAGKSYRVTVRGKYNTDATNPAQMNWKVKLGGTVIAASGNAGLGTNKVDKGYEVHCDFTCRTTGSTGTVMAQGMFFTEDGPGAKNMTNGFATTTIDTTVSNAVDVTVTLTDSSSGNSCYAYILILEEI
jgi:hypothetical protein